MVNFFIANTWLYNLVTLPTWHLTDNVYFHELDEGHTLSGKPVRAKGSLAHILIWLILRKEAVVK